MVERVGDDRVVLAQDRLEQPAVGVEAGGVEDRVVGAEEAREGVFEVFVQGLGPADEAHRRHAIAVAIHRLGGRPPEAFVVGQAQVVVGTEVDDLGAVVEGDHRILG